MKRNYFNPNATPDELRQRNEKVMALLKKWEAEPELPCSLEDLTQYENEIDNAGICLGEVHLVTNALGSKEPNAHASAS